MRIGIIKEGKNPPDKRVPFSPEQCKQLQNNFSGLKVIVQKSKVRAFSDQAYEEQGLELVDDISSAEVLFGVKEVNKEDLIADKTFFFFSHTIKEQPYNRDLLKTVLKKNIRLIDYECLVEENGARLLGFGRYAGIVGAYNGLLAYGKRTQQFNLKPAHQCKDKEEMMSELKRVSLPRDYKICISGLGRVAGGAMEILDALEIRKVSPLDYTTQDFKEAVYTQLSVLEYFKKSDSSSFDRSEVYKDPTNFESNFMAYAAVSDMYISCHYWDSRGPGIFTKEDLKSDLFRIRTIADISCDIDGPIPTTIKPSTIDEPIYQINRLNCEETKEIGENTITVMAVDNLPCELPKDASEGFGDDLIKKVIPAFFNKDKDGILERATIAQNGSLTERYSYLESYVND